MTDLNDLAHAVNTIPDASDDQWADARAYLTRNAPDLVAMVLGEETR